MNNLEKVNELIKRMNNHQSLSETLLVQACLEEGFELRDEIKKGCHKFVNEYNKDGDGEHFICDNFHGLCRECKKALKKILEITS